LISNKQKNEYAKGEEEAAAAAAVEEKNKHLIMILKSL